MLICRDCGFIVTCGGDGEHWCGFRRLALWVLRISGPNDAEKVIAALEAT